MSVKVTDYTDSVKADIKSRSAIFIRYAMDEMESIAQPRTPRKSGRLRQNVLRQVLGTTGQIRWGQKYATIQETTQFKHYTTAGTGPKFADSSARSIATNASKSLKRAGLL